jgi:hypothetical protein
VECLEVEVLRQLCSPPTDAQEHWPPRLLLAGEALVERLAAQSLEAVSSTIGARFHLHRLVQREVASFIRYQLTAADLDQLDIFKPQVIELIEIYADGDPVVVNGLARRILKIVPELVARRRELAKQESAEDPGTETTLAIDTAAPAVTESAAPDQVSPPEAAVSLVLPIPETVSAQAPVVSPPPESAAPALDPPAIPPPAPVPETLEASPPAEPEPPVAQIPEPVSAPAEPSAVIEATPPIETGSLLAQSGEEASTPLVTEPPIALSIAPVSGPELETTPSAALPAAAAAPQLLSVAPESVPEAAEPPLATVVDSQAIIALETDTEPTASPDRDVPETAPPKKRRHLVALSCALAAAVIGVVIALGATQRRDAEGTYLDAAVKFVRSTSLFASAAKMSTDLIGASAPVPKDLGTQRLRTTSNDASQNLLIAPEPTATNGAKAEEPAARSASESAAPLPPAPPEPSHPVVASPPPPPSETVVAVAAPPAPIPAPPAPISAPPTIAAPATPVTPVKHESPAPPAPKDTTSPAANRTLSNGDIDSLLRHGDQLLASGDIIAARNYFALVAEAGDARAALRLGKTYDPAFLQQSGARGIAGDPAAAKSWYLKAIASGDKEADLQLLRLMTLYPQ